MNQKTKSTKKKYNRVARIYDASEYFVEQWLFKRVRKLTIGKLRGNILEVGVGTGKNLEFYHPSAKVTGIDISDKMMDKARIRAKKAKADITLKAADAQHLPFPDQFFDAVIDTFVLCSIPDPVKAVKEMRRVVKKDGIIISIEHVLSRHWLLALFEYVHDPITSWLFGFHVNRDTLKNIELAGGQMMSDHYLAFFDVFRKFTYKR